MAGLLMNWEGYGSIHGISEVISQHFSGGKTMET
jgi:hypothetical protein